MLPSQTSLDPLQQVHELNRLFLTHLQKCVRDDIDCCGLPDFARSPLRRASTDSIAAIAVFPRALFDIKLDDSAPSSVRDPLRSRDDGARHALGLTILLCAWTLSRQSNYQARLLLGLEARAIQRMRAMQLSDLQPHAYSPQIVCAFAGRDWIWNELLNETRPEARQQLALVALQPGLSRDWPIRRAARLST